jgi:hypothetical protein
VRRTLTVTVLPTASRFSSIESTSLSGAALTSSLTSPPMPRPTGLLIFSESRRLFVTASAIGLAISKPESSAAPMFSCCFLPPSIPPTTPAATPPPAEAFDWVHPRGRATIAASTSSPGSR